MLAPQLLEAVMNDLMEFPLRPIVQVIGDLHELSHADLRNCTGYPRQIYKLASVGSLKHPPYD